MLYSKSTGGFYVKEVHGNKIPSDAAEITKDEHAALLAGQAAGNLIQPDEDGLPALAERPAPTAEQLESSARASRNKLISDTDYMLMPDYPLSEPDLLAVKGYRQALRDISKQKGFPENIEWPKAP